MLSQHRHDVLADCPSIHPRPLARAAVAAPAHPYVPLDPVEIVAHEFEHLVEQIEGTDLRTLARVRGSGVSEIRTGEFETLRAVEAGRRVLAECGDADRGPFTLDAGTIDSPEP